MVGGDGQPEQAEFTLIRLILAVVSLRVEHALEVVQLAIKPLGLCSAGGTKVLSQQRQPRGAVLGGSFLSE